MISPALLIAPFSPYPLDIFIRLQGK